MSKHEDKDMVIRATGYHYPKSFYDFLLEMDYNEQLEKEKARLRSLPDNVCEEITINKIPEVSYKNFNPVRHSMLWAKLVKDQKLKDDLIMSIMWYKEKDEKLMRESPLLRIMDCIHLPSFIKVALVCLKAAEDVEEIGGKYYRPNVMLAEALWNLNPNFPERRKEWQFIENIPLLKELIPPMEFSPRPHRPLDPNVAATKIQAVFRGYLVRKMPEVLELRAFWETSRLISQIKLERHIKTSGKTPKWKNVYGYHRPEKLSET